MDSVERRGLRGWELLRLRSEQLVLDVVPGLGGTIVSLRRRSDDTEILWATPWGLRQQGSFLVPGDAEAQMLDTYPGGWQTIFPNGGETAIVHGVEWGFDGETRITPFTWEETPLALTMTSRLVRSPFEVTKTISLAGAEVHLEETVRNVGGESLEVMWGQQLVFGAPLVSGDTVVDAAAAAVHPDPQITMDSGYEDVMPWPRSFGSTSIINLRTVPEPGSSETRLAYLTDFDEPRVSITNPRLDLAVDLSWDLETWPSVWYSMESGLRSGFPWFSKGYFLSLTPSSSWPGHGMHDARRVAQTTMWFLPGEERTSRLTLGIRPA